MTKPKPEPIKLQTIIDAELEILGGVDLKDVAKKYGIKPKQFNQSIERVSEIMNSDAPELALERKIISEALTEKMKPIKEQLALKSLEIINEADKLISDRMKSDPDQVKTKDLVNISDNHSKRLARITGMEEDPNAGTDNDKTRVKKVNIFIQNIFGNHKEKLEKERDKVNDIELTPVYEEDKAPVEKKS